MRVTLKRFPIAGLASFLLCLSLTQVSAEPLSLSLTDCQVDGLEGGARCGALVVAENPAVPAGRSITLRLVVLPARSPVKRDDPIVFLAGGPGQAASEQASFVASLFSPLREDRDIVLLDLRGTGGSNHLTCDFHQGADSPQAYLDNLLPPLGIRACRESLDADLRFYNTSTAVEDLEAVRIALQAPQLNLFGSSYGTRVALVYLKRYEHRVRSVILKSVLPEAGTVLAAFARDAQRALDALFDDCALEPACQRTFPDARSSFARALGRLERGPAIITLPGDEGDEPVQVSYSKDSFVEAVRNLLYQPFSAARLPLMFRKAAAGDYRDFATFSLAYAKAVTQNLSLGFFLSVTCTEDVPFIDPDLVARNSVNTFYGDYRYRQQRAACLEWSRGELPKDFAVPVESAVPALVISGGLDPVLPPRWGELVVRNLSSSLHFVFLNGGHSFANMQGCVDRVMNDFVRNGSVEALDIGCGGKIRRPPFKLPEAL